MTQTQARDQLRDLLNQTNVSNTQFDNDIIDDAVSAASTGFCRDYAGRTSAESQTK